MNYVILSPHFPSNYYQFCVRLRALGANVFGIADEPYENLNQELKESLNEYFYVPNMHQYEDLVRAIGYLTYRWGKIDGLDSFSEYWMETEAKLRKDFNIDGLQPEELPSIKRKSLMKGMYKKAGVETALGIIAGSVAEAKRFAHKIGFPLIAKPDIGVGAAHTYKFDSMDQLETFFAAPPPVDYFLEQYIKGYIETFDGLTDQNGDIIFFSSLVFPRGIMETVTEDSDMYYYTQREIPSDLEQAGRKVVRAYNIRKRFFHLEFFRTVEGSLIGLEVNMRPPGGLTTDMFNYANDLDIYYEWADVVLHNRFSASVTRPYFCAYIGRKWNLPYIHTHDEIKARFGDLILQDEPVSGVFEKVLGSYGYIVRSPDLETINRIVDFVHQKVGQS